MMKKALMKCPVCGKYLPYDALPITGKCRSCGFVFAEVQLFADEQSREAWQKLVEKHKALLAPKLTADDIQLVMQEKSLGILDRKTKVYRSVSFTGNVTSRKGIRMVSAGPSHIVFLKEDGTLESEGNSDGGRRDLNDLKDIVFVAASDENTYAVTKDGRVIEKGPGHFGGQIRSWKNIVSIACGRNHIAGLTRNGDVLFGGSILSPAEYQISPNWKNMKQITACGDLTAGLGNDGKLKVMGLRGGGDDRSLATMWTNISNVTADSSFIYGLTEEGNILIAGNCPVFLERGRREAVKWPLVVSIAGCRSGISAVTEDGNIFVAGGISQEKADMLRDKFLDKN